MDDVADTLAGHLSVGQLAERTGITPETLRVWERRYGDPRAARLPSGHRRYDPGLVPRLLRVAEGLALGHRPSELLALPPKELEALVRREGRRPRGAETAWLALVRELRAQELFDALETGARGSAPIDFLERSVAPFLRLIGDEWAAGRLGVRHEHLASEIVEEVLRGMRRRRARRDPLEADRLVLACLPSEQHELGLWMAALLAEERGIPTRVLGPNMPIEEIRRAVDDGPIAAVGVSISLANGGARSHKLLGALRKRLPRGVELVAGGAGARRIGRGPRGVTWFHGLAGFAAWLDELAGARAEASA